MDVIIWWFGAIVLALIVVAALFSALLWLYANLIAGRFQIRLGKTQYDMSLASWHDSWISGNKRPADNHPIRWPFFIAYKIGKKRLFLMAAVLDERECGKVSRDSKP